MMVQTPVAGGPYTITFKAGNVINLQNVMIGEVWVCSGQSNMEYNSFYAGSKDIQPEFKNPANNNIHFFLETRSTSQYDKTFYPAEGKISGNKLLVWSDKVKEPVAVRFAFSSAAVGNLFSKNGLPVTPFKTDNWNVIKDAVK